MSIGVVAPLKASAHFRAISACFSKADLGFSALSPLLLAAVVSAVLLEEFSVFGSGLGSGLGGLPAKPLVPRAKGSRLPLPNLLLVLLVVEVVEDADFDEAVDVVLLTLKAAGAEVVLGSVLTGALVSVFVLLL